MVDGSSRHGPRTLARPVPNILRRQDTRTPTIAGRQERYPLSGRGDDADGRSGTEERSHGGGKSVRERGPRVRSERERDRLDQESRKIPRDPRRPALKPADRVAQEPLQGHLRSKKIAQNKPRSTIREGGPRRPVSHDWRAATQQLLKNAKQPVLRDKQIFSPRTVSDGGTTPSRI